MTNEPIKRPHWLAGIHNGIPEGTVPQEKDEEEQDEPEADESSEEDELEEEGESEGEDPFAAMPDDFDPGCPEADEDPVPSDPKAHLGTLPPKGSAELERLAVTERAAREEQERVHKAEEDRDKVEAEEAARKEAEEKARIEKEVRAEIKRFDRLRREERERADREAKEKREKITKFLDRFPRAVAFSPLSGDEDRKLRAFEKTIVETRDPKIAAKLFKAYDDLGFVLVDLDDLMQGHPEEDARSWPTESDDDFLAWQACNRADWLVWSCAKVKGWGYPGLWRAVSECAETALGFAEAELPKAVVEACRLSLNRLRRIIKNYFEGYDVGERLFRLHEILSELAEAVPVKDEFTYHMVRACFYLTAPVEREDCEPHVESVVHSALVLAKALPQFPTTPGWFMPLAEDLKERDRLWRDKGRQEHELMAKLEFLAPTIRRYVPVPIDPDP